MPTLPKDNNRKEIQGLPFSKASLAETYDTSVSGSTEITLNASTTVIEVTAITKPIMMKWGTADATTADFDHVIQAGTTRTFIVPVETASTGAIYTAVNFIEQAASAVLAVSEF